MQCCMPLCENTSENFSKSGIITFHGFPSVSGLRAAWLRVLGIQDSQLLDSAVVCSQHFLPEDICKTESGSRQLRTGAVPSTVLVCMTCLNTDSKMSLVSQYKLEEAYEKLTGHPLWDSGNLKHTLCAQCAQQLKNFSRFREQSLTARSLMIELLEKHEVITLQHIKRIQLKNNLVSTTLRPDPCDMYIQGNSDEDRQTGSQETVHGVTVKTECSEDSQWVDENTQGIKEENADCASKKFDADLIKYENSAFICTVCCEQFPHEHAYSAHECTHLHDARPAAPSSHTAQTPLSLRLATNTIVTNSGASDNRAPVFKLHDILEYPQNSEIKVESSPQILGAVSCSDILYAHTACEDAQYCAASEDEVAATHEPAASVLSGTEPGTSGHSSHTPTFICDVCEDVFTQKDHLVGHMKHHAGEKPYPCKICSHKFAYNTGLARHMRTHIGEKPYYCVKCSYKCAIKDYLVSHMRKHTGEKPYSCKICGYKFANNSNLVTHMRIHAGEKPYSCKICSYKFTKSSSLVTHMRTHTGEKPYSCEKCSYKCTIKGYLVRHMRKHTGEKPYSCKTCGYKFADNGNLVTHMRTHTGEKPYSCKICSYKFTKSSSLVTHMRIHTGEKPYSCEKCSYKFSKKSDLVRHMRTHTGAH